MSDPAPRGCPEGLLKFVRPSPALSPSTAHPRILPPLPMPLASHPVPAVVTNVAADLVASRSDPTLVTHSSTSAVASPRNDSAGGLEGVDVYAKPVANARSETPIPPAPTLSPHVVVGVSAKRGAKESSTASTPLRHSWSFASVCAARDVISYAYIVDVTSSLISGPGMGSHTPMT